jgi:hypothetical protein
LRIMCGMPYAKNDTVPTTVDTWVTNLTVTVCQ